MSAAIWGGTPPCFVAISLGCIAVRQTRCRCQGRTELIVDINPFMFLIARQCQLG
ncbi:MAG: hypothetical protein KDA68_19020 [Planctomycetaceae bacterium]|nr:hypothetical protein [Planctomycetaceae bacterium]